MIRPSRLATLVLATLLVLPTAIAQQASFEGLGVLSSQIDNSEAVGVSADGQVVSGTIGSLAFRWEAGELEELPLPDETVYATAHAISADGSTIVGLVSGPVGTNTIRAFRWTPDAGTEVLGLLDAGGTLSEAWAASASGAVVVGLSTRSDGRTEAFRWTNDDGMAGLGFVPGWVSSAAYDVSTDGSVIVGTSGQEAFRWTADAGIEGLGIPDGYNESAAWRVTPDGALIFGQLGGDLARWTADAGWEILGKLPEAFGCLPAGTSADGSVVVGTCSGFFDDDDGVFIWTEQDGVRFLRDVLEQEHGLDLTGWQLRSATGVSADGRVIVGSGRNPDGFASQAWRAVLGGAVAGEIPARQPGGIAIEGPFPNPASGATSIRITLPEAGPVRIDLYDLLGRRAARLADADLPAGTTDLPLANDRLAAGVYILRVSAGAELSQHRLIIAR
jgi:probable HAF family extracellular repeat protein